MEKFFDRLDELAGIEAENWAAKWLERAAFVFLVLMVVSAPHSIAATQIAWLTGMFLWIVRLFLKPLQKFKLSALDYALWAFFLWSVITSFTSYAPDISLDKLRGVIVFLIFYFVFHNVRKLRTVYFLTFALIFSCMVNVVWTPIQRLIGRGVEIHGLAPDGPLAKALLTEGDTLLAANGKKVTTPEDVLGEIKQNETTKVKFYRPDFDFDVQVKRADLLPGDNALAKLGFESWTKSRNWRSSGFYGHYTTYAEVLQLIASLVFGLFIAGLTASPRRNVAASAFLIISLAGMCLALLLTVTRASQLAFMISAFLIVLLTASRKLLLAAVVIGLPVAFAGLLFLQQSREVGFFDSKDDSIIYRETMWQDGYRIWTESPRNFMAGVGMDSIQRYWREWGMFDGGRLPMGHFHSTPVQLLVERGLPALLIWLMVLGIYARTLWKGLRATRDGDCRARGILLGCLGGMIGFFTSGLVHYNLGDQEVAMMFFLLMGLSIKVTEFTNLQTRSLPPENSRGYRSLRDWSLT